MMRYFFMTYAVMRLPAIGGHSLSWTFAAQSTHSPITLSNGTENI